MSHTECVTLFVMLRGAHPTGSVIEVEWRPNIGMPKAASTWKKKENSCPCSTGRGFRDQRGHAMPCPNPIPRRSPQESPGRFGPLGHLLDPPHRASALDDQISPPFTQIKKEQFQQDTSANNTSVLVKLT